MKVLIVNLIASFSIICAAKAQKMSIEHIPADPTNNVVAFIKIRFNQLSGRKAILWASNTGDFSGNVQLVAHWDCPAEDNQHNLAFFPEAFYGPTAFFIVESPLCDDPPFLQFINNPF